MSDPCVFCGEPTAFGSGRFVDRIPADNGEAEGFACYECMQMECDRCDEPIICDQDISPEMCCPLHGIKEDGTEDTFSDGAMRVHYDCLTEKEKWFYDNA